MVNIIDDTFYWNLIITLEEKKNELEPKLSHITKEEFEEYSMIVNVLGPLYHYLEKE